MAKAQSEPNPEMSPKEVAEYLGVSLPTVRRLTERGLLTRYEKLYGKPRVFFKREEVVALKERSDSGEGGKPKKERPV